MKIETEQRCAVTLVKPDGPLSGPDADELRVMMSDLIQTHMGRVVLDASDIPSVDSPGLESLVDIAEQLAQSGKALKLCALNETLQQVIDLTGLSPQFEQFEDANSAIRSFL
jgi:anti-sigma B factor antagonist